MKLAAALLAVVAAQDEDRWSFYDYSMPNEGRVGHAISGVLGGHAGNRRFCHSTIDTQHIYRWDASKHGYFAHFNPVECVGEELFCTIEERAHFGQVIGIRAGCAQMMNHPQVPTIAPVTNQAENKNHYNQEAARGATFNQGAGNINIFYGIGGCLALPAQNGYLSGDSTWLSSLQNNHFLGTHGGYGQGQCLRFQTANAKTGLLPFGVSVCRACCIADDYFEAAADAENSVADGPCNFWPVGKNKLPTGMTAAAFDCFEADSTSCTFTGAAGTSTCDICTKEMFPNFSMVSQPSYTARFNLFMTGTTPFCSGTTCTPANAYSRAQPIVGGR